MGVLAVGEPHAVHAFPGDPHITDLAWLCRILNAVDPNTGLIRHTRRNRLVKIGALLVLNRISPAICTLCAWVLFGCGICRTTLGSAGSLASKIVSAIGEVPRWAT